MAKQTMEEVGHYRVTDLKTLVQVVSLVTFIGSIAGFGMVVHNNLEHISQAVRELTRLSDDASKELKAIAIHESTCAEKHRAHERRLDLIERKINRLNGR